MSAPPPAIVYPPIARLTDGDPTLGLVYTYYVFDYYKSKLYYDMAMKRPVKCGLGHHMTASIRHKSVNCDHKKCKQTVQVRVELLK